MSSLRERFFPPAVADESQISSRSAGRVRFRDFSTWPIAARAVFATMLLSVLAILVVETFLSTAISDALYELRRDRSLEQSEALRSALVSDLEPLVGTSVNERQDVIISFMEGATVGDPKVFKGLAVIPMGSTAGEAVTNNGALTAFVSEKFERELDAASDQFVYRSIEYVERGDSGPAILVGTTIDVPGAGLYRLLMLYSVNQEQETLDRVNTILVIGGAVLVLLFFLVSLAISRIVTTPLKRAARAVDHISENDLDYRLAIQGGDDLARMGTSFNNMAASLQSTITELVELSELEKRFVSDVSHELRTPFTTIKMAASMLEMEKDSFSPSGKRSLELLKEQVARFESLIADLLEISRHEAGTVELEAKPTSLEGLVDDVVEQLEPIATEYAADIRVQHLSVDTVGDMDSRRIERIVRNLLTNAIEHGAGGVIDVRTASRGSTLALTVQDFGVGLSPEEATRVFDRFWRAAPSRTHTLGGTGLGLAIAHEDAEAHGGLLEAWGVKGETAVFRLLLPRSSGAKLTASPLALVRSAEKGEAE